jgi:hypothetical protein
MSNLATFLKKPLYKSTPKRRKQESRAAEGDTEITTSHRGKGVLPPSPSPSIHPPQIEFDMHPMNGTKVNEQQMEEEIRKSSTVSCARDALFPSQARSMIRRRGGGLHGIDEPHHEVNMIRNA